MADTNRAAIPAELMLRFLNRHVGQTAKENQAGNAQGRRDSQHIAHLPGGGEQGDGLGGGEGDAAAGPMAVTIHYKYGSCVNYLPLPGSLQA